MPRFAITKKKGPEETIEAKSFEDLGSWFVFVDDDDEEVFRVASSEVASIGRLDARKGPSLA